MFHVHAYFNMTLCTEIKFELIFFLLTCGLGETYYSNEENENATKKQPVNSCQPELSRCNRCSGSNVNCETAI